LNNVLLNDPHVIFLLLLSLFFKDKKQKQEQVQVQVQVQEKCSGVSDSVKHSAT
jgi:hypothetical protein